VIGTGFAHLRDVALAYPEAAEDFPWGECTIKVRGKIFLMLRGDERGLGLTLKLPQSREFALDYPFAEPTGYGLGRSGWVTSSLGAAEDPPLDLFRAWIDESYRAVAPKALVKTLPARASADGA
jgi:predicted DNA-binding protein (MmcQ/YjbR family)